MSLESALDLTKLAEDLPDGKTVIPAKVVVNKQGSSVIIDMSIAIRIKKKRLFKRREVKKVNESKI